MNAAARAHPEPVDRFAPGTGSGLSAALVPAVERALAWAGEGLRALVLSGSHATGEAVWAELDGRRVSLSDLDLYAILRDESACAAAAARARADRAGSARANLDAGLAAPLEVAFVTLEGLKRMPAKPGTVELVRSGRVIAGEADVLARLPRWAPAAVSAEERLLLLENRAFELLWAHGAPREGLAGLQARHAVLKAALDVAAARTLAAGELPAGARARVERARALGAPQGLPSWLAGAWEGVEPLWQEALAWRSEGARAASPEATAAGVRTAARAWSAAWWAEGGPAAPLDPWERARRVAARGSLARRLRRSLAFQPARADRPGPLDRLRHAPAGTPPLRIHGAAVVLVLAAAQSPHEPRLPVGALRALRALGVTRATRFDDAAIEAVRAWDRLLHEGQRTADES